MSDDSGRGAQRVAVVILVAVGLANWGYAFFRMSQDRSGNLPLMIAGLASLTLALVLLKRRN